jgi:hypothetical protein
MKMEVPTDSQSLEGKKNYLKKNNHKTRIELEDEFQKSKVFKIIKK